MKTNLKTLKFGLLVWGIAASTISLAAERAGAGAGTGASAPVRRLSGVTEEDLREYPGAFDGTPRELLDKHRPHFPDAEYSELEERVTGLQARNIDLCKLIHLKSQVNQLGKIVAECAKFKESSKP